MYNTGTIKLVWFENYNLLKSQMFDTIEQALKRAKELKLGSDFMINRLKQNKGDYYEWDVLPYGKYISYKYGMIVTQNKLILGSLTFLAIYGIFKLIKR
jgi:hypothetical protein